MKPPKSALSFLPIFVLFSAAQPLLPAQNTRNIRHYPATSIDAQSTVGRTPLTEMEPMPLVAPIFIEDGHTSSSLVIANSTAIGAGATITVRSLSGSEVGTGRKVLAPHQQMEISMQSLLAGFASPITSGSVTVTQDANLRGPG